MGIPVLECGVGLNGALGDHANTVHVRREALQDAMPVDGDAFGHDEVVLQVHDDRVTFAHLPHPFSFVSSTQSEKKEGGGREGKGEGKGRRGSVSLPPSAKDQYF